MRPRGVRRGAGGRRSWSSAGRDSGLAWWPVMGAYALMLKRKPGGVRSTQRTAVAAAGIA